MTWCHPSSLSYLRSSALGVQRLSALMITGRGREQICLNSKDIHIYIYMITGIIVIPVFECWSFSCTMLYDRNEERREPYPEPTYTGWSSVHWNATGWPGVHWDTTGWPSKYLILAGYTGTSLKKLIWNWPILECHWRNSDFCSLHWNTTGGTIISPPPPPPPPRHTHMHI